MVEITHAIRALAFVSCSYGRTGFTLYPVFNSMRLVPTFFGEPGLHLCIFSPTQSRLALPNVAPERGLQFFDRCCYDGAVISKAGFDRLFRPGLVTCRGRGFIHHHPGPFSIGEFSEEV